MPVELLNRNDLSDAFNEYAAPAGRLEPKPAAVQPPVVPAAAAPAAAETSIPQGEVPAAPEQPITEATPAVIAEPGPQPDAAIPAAPAPQPTAVTPVDAPEQLAKPVGAPESTAGENPVPVVPVADQPAAPPQLEATVDATGVDSPSAADTRIIPVVAAPKPADPFDDDDDGF
ncbi:hypothetical protein [Corynebacterium occultum]|uniref:hypothetical protein n=1 Tax=Corynebacterium occultum TaxID=2675219 RepID=UPI0012E1F357|nr:hypothetical protein [Corynebacterium occultum]